MLSAIQSAVRDAHVKPIEEGSWGSWGPAMRRSLFQFDYLGFRYELAGEYKAARIHVDTLEKIARVEEGDFFSGDFADSMTLIIEDYRIKRQQENPNFGTW